MALLRLKMDIEPGALHLRNVALDGRHHANIVEIGRAEREDDAVQLFHGFGEEIADPVQGRVATRAERSGSSGVLDARARLVECSSNQRRHVVDLAGNSPPLVLLQTHRAPVQIAQLLGLGGASLFRLLQIADLLAEVPGRCIQGRAEIRDLACFRLNQFADQNVRERFRLETQLAQWPRQQFGGERAQRQGSQRCRDNSRDGARDHGLVRSVRGG